MAVTEDHRRVRIGLEDAGLPDARLTERYLASVVDRLHPEAIALADALAVWTSFDRIERLAASAKLLLGARVEAGGVWRRTGARSAADHLAKVSGTSASAVRRQLESSKQLGDLPNVSAALRNGALSTAQVEAIVPAAASDPAAADQLLDLAQTTNVNELREACLRTRAAADPDPDATHARIHAHRYLRTHTDGEGARNLSVRGPADRLARIERALEPFIDDAFAQGRADGRPEPREAYAFDEVVALAERDERPTGKKRTPKPRYLALLHLPFEALVRGAVEGEPTCEIVGIGPIPVRIARELLGESILKLVITKGSDVANVVHLGRSATAAQRIALLWSKPKCANMACSSMFVQLDHRDPWAATKQTRLEQLDPLCPHDHDLKTYGGWSLVDGTGRRAFVPPDDPRHPRHKPPP